MKKKVLILTPIVLGILILLVRLFSPAHLDDVSPAIPCEKELYDRAGILFVIPLYENVSIADNPEWCKMILSLNKTIGMHGVYHSYKEFTSYRDEGYVNEGVIAFEKCFGYRPEIFKPPQMAYNRVNDKNLQGINVVSYFEQVFHKEFHCDNTGALPNWFYDFV
jgi:hypothetical protein